MVFKVLKPFEETVLKPKNGKVQPPVNPPPNALLRRTNVLDSLRKILVNVIKKPWSLYFRKPVDSTKPGMGEYHKLIKRPMDLGTIKKRLDNKYYRQSKEAVKDFKLVFENCLKFHKKGTKEKKGGYYLKNFFNQTLSKIDLTKEMVVRRKSRKQKPKRESKPPSQPEKPMPLALKQITIVSSLQVTYVHGIHELSNF